MGKTRSPLSIFTGQEAQIRAVTLSHGVIRPNLVDGLDYTLKISGKEVPEFDNKQNALIYTTFDGATGKMSYTKSNQGQIEALLMDTDPSVEEIWVSPTEFKNFTVFENLKGLDGKIKGSVILQECHPTGDPFTSTVKDAQKGGLDFMFINAHRFMGLAIQHIRARAGVVLIGVPASPTLGTATTGGFLAPSTYYVRITAITADGESQGSTEVDIVVPTGTSTNVINVTTPAPAGSIVSYNIYVSDRSNGERFAGNDGGSSAFVVTNLPASSDESCPNIDTTGAFQAPGDIEFAGNTITLPKAAFAMPQNGMQYALIMKNGEVVADPVNPATGDDFYFNAAGTAFAVGTTPASKDYWDIFTLYQP
jgi:hypothetical protein